MNEAWPAAMTLFAYALIFCALAALISTLAYVWNAYQERKFGSDPYKLGPVSDARERFLASVDEPYDNEASLWTR